MNKRYKTALGRRLHFMIQTGYYVEFTAVLDNVEQWPGQNRRLKGFLVPYSAHSGVVRPENAYCLQCLRYDQLNIRWSARQAIQPKCAYCELRYMLEKVAAGEGYLVNGRRADR